LSNCSSTTVRQNLTPTAGSFIRLHPMSLHILSIQSSVAFGHVGNNAAVFPLQRIGVEVWPVNTVHFSNHTGYDSWRGMVLPVEAVAEVIKGLDERQILRRCSGILSGYLGDVALGRVVLEAVAKVQQASPEAVYCCDPVMGDVGRGFFVRPGIPEFMKDHAVPAATIVTPNQFELEYLAGEAVTDLKSALAGVDKVLALGPQIVMITSLRRQNDAEERIGVLAATSREAHLVETPVLPLNVNGAGDMTAALFFAHWLRNRSIKESLELTIGAVFGVLQVTAQTGERELQLVKAQAAIANPERRFLARKVR
jgi:pyridoxine kinase